MNTKVIDQNEKIKLAKDEVIYKKGLTSKEIYSINNLQKISILTTDEGPFSDDVALAMFFGETVLILPSQHKYYDEMLDSLYEAFPLDSKEVIKAMSSVENAEFILWEK